MTTATELQQMTACNQNVKTASRIASMASRWRIISRNTSNLNQNQAEDEREAGGEVLRL